MKGSVRKRGNSWSYSFDLGFVQGKRKRQEKGGYRTKKDAQNGLREALTEYEQCCNVFKPNEISVHDYLNYWFDNYVLVNCKLNTQTYYRRILDNHIIPYFKDYKLKHLKADVLQKFLNYKKRNGLSKNSITNYYGVLSGALTWNDIDLINGTIYVQHTLIHGEKGSKQFVLGTPKTPSSYRVIHIGNSLTNLLIKHKEYQDKNRETYGEWYHDSNFICTKENGEQITTDSYKYLSRVVNYELGIKFSMHSLRHTHATMLLEQGANIKDIQRRLGHSKLSTTMDTYSHVTDIMRNSTVNIFEKIADKLPTSY